MPLSRNPASEGAGLPAGRRAIANAPTARQELPPKQRMECAVPGPLGLFGLKEINARVKARN